MSRLSVASPSLVTRTCRIAGGVRQDLSQQRHQGGVHDDHVVPGVRGDVADHLRVEPQVQRVQHRAHGRDRQVGLEVLGVVPHQRGYPLVAVDAQAAQRVGQLGGPGAGHAVALPPRARRRAGHHLAVGIGRRAVAHDRRHGQRNVHHRALHWPPPVCLPGSYPARDGPQHPWGDSATLTTKRHSPASPAMT